MERQPLVKHNSLQNFTLTYEENLVVMDKLGSVEKDNEHKNRFYEKSARNYSENYALYRDSSFFKLQSDLRFDLFGQLPKEGAFM